MGQLFLLNKLDEIQPNSLPPSWNLTNSKQFSKNKMLFDYQLKALENAIKVLYEYYNNQQGDKSKFFKLYQKEGFSDNLGLESMVNRASFWMATGSGKTLVIVKLIEILANLMKNDCILKKDVLFLTARDDLIEQFEEHVNEFNSGGNSIKINLRSLKEYETVKANPTLGFSNEFTVFYYRSDLFSDEGKDKIVDYKTYDNNGNWYIILDEAHKGDRYESKRQKIFTEMTRNGFLFNFSATFVDPIDIVTCAYNFNLEKLIKGGYGKDIYVSEHDIKVLGSKEEFTESQKIEITIRILILLTALKKIKKELGSYYHKPMLIALVNSVNTDDSDLELFFRIMEEIANKEIDTSLLKKVKDDLYKELNNAKTEFTETNISKKLLDTIDNINQNDILNEVFNSQSHAKIEVKVLPNNKQEMALSLQTASKPFALIKIGDITKWIKEKLEGYEIIESFENESMFKQINEDDSDINILLGSRSFYEGWDSNRPNIILYINIGKNDAKKFLLQSIGRGVRINPISSLRMRWDFIKSNLDPSDFEKFKDHARALETLFVYGTKASNIKEIVETVKEEKTEENIGDFFEINPDTKDKPLLIPVYREEEPLWLRQRNLIKFVISQIDFDAFKTYVESVTDVILLIKHDIMPLMLKKLKKSLSNITEYYKIDEHKFSIGNPELTTELVLRQFDVRTESLDHFKRLENEIIHFKHISVSKDKIEKIRNTLESVKSHKKDEIYRDKETRVHLYFKLDRLLKHYYLPICIADDEKVNFINHIIKVESEFEFLDKLEKYIEDNGDVFKNFEWWFFSKIDETLDNVYIPYYNPMTNNLNRFKPDFIFWFKPKESDKLFILFVDPKSAEYTSAFDKIKGYAEIFEENGAEKEFQANFKGRNLTVKVFLRLWTDDVARIQVEEMKKYWADNFETVMKDLLQDRRSV